MCVQGMGSGQVLPGATGDTGPEGLDKPGSRGECWSPSPEARTLIPNPEQVMAGCVPEARSTLAKTRFVYHKLERSLSKDQGPEGCLEA